MIAQLVERRTVVGFKPVILRSAVRLRLAGMGGTFLERSTSFYTIDLTAHEIDIMTVFIVLHPF